MITSFIILYYIFYLHHKKNPLGLLTHLCNGIFHHTFVCLLGSLTQIESVQKKHANLSLNHHILEAAMRSFQKQILHLD